jgi:Carboxypeptidase regulatory-like domain
MSKLFLKPQFGLYSLLLICLLALLFPTQSLAQGYGSIVGSVTDDSGATIPTATVTVTQDSTGRVTTVQTSGQGAYVFPSLTPAEYTISVTSAGFETSQKHGVVLQADQSLTLNVQLAVGAATTSVEVTSAAPSVDTTTGTLSQVIGQETVVDLPLNGRNAATLVTLVAGVVIAPGNGLDQGSTKTFPAAVSITANGSQATQQNFLLNGGNNLDEMTNVNAPFPFPDALREFSVQTSNYNAEFGQAAGAVVNIVTKSGGNKFHGSAFEFLRNGYFNAKPYFANSADTLHRNQFGGTIGGPVIIPHISSGARTQFFFGYQRTELHQLSSTSSALVPTLNAEGLDPTTPGYKKYGDFSSVCTGTFNAAGICSNAAQQIYDPAYLLPTTTAACSTPPCPSPFAFNHIPVSRFDPASANFETHIPTAAGTGISGTVQYKKPTTQTFNEYFARVDHSFGDRDHLFGHYYYNDFDQLGIYDPAELLSYASFSNVRYQNALLSETHTFSSNLLNSLVVNYQREVSLRGGPPGSPNITAFGVQNVFQPPQNSLINSVAVSGFFTVSASAFAAWGRNNYTLNDDVHWVKGNHNFGFGGHIELSKFDVTNVGSTNGTFGFSATNTNNALASYQLGYLSSFGQGGAEFVNDRANFPGLYAQDSWKATRRLTLGYGLRWEVFEPWNNTQGEQTLFSPSAYAAGVTSTKSATLPAGLFVTGDAGVPPKGVYNQYKQFMPRVSFAYDLTGDGKAVIRGGAGMFYQDRLPGFFNINQAAHTPFTINVGLTNPGGKSVGGPFSNPYCVGCTANNGNAVTGGATAGAINNPYPYTLPFPSNYVFPRPILVTEYDPSGKFQVPLTTDYNLTFERDVVADFTFRLAYVGSTSRHQFVNLDLNPSVNNGSGLSTDQRRSYNTVPKVGPCTTAAGCQANYSNIVLASMSGSGNYNSLQATIEKKMSHGFSLLVNYTWSKGLDDLPYALGVSNTENLNAGESYVYPVYPTGASSWNPTNYKALDRGLSDFDHRHVISASYVYALPKLHEGNGVVKAILNGWRTSGIIQYRTGDALTAAVGASKDVSLTGLNQDRAQYTGVPLYTRQTGTGTCLSSTAHCVNFITPGAFVVPVNSGANSGTGFGNVVKGSIAGPAFTNWDAVVIRSFPIYRESALDFRVEYFDVLNHTQLGDPNLNPTTATLGTITTTSGGPRIAQFSLTLMF